MDASSISDLRADDSQNIGLLKKVGIPSYVEDGAYEMRSDDDNYGLNMPQLRKAAIQKNFVIQKNSTDKAFVNNQPPQIADRQHSHDDNLFDRSFDSDQKRASKNNSRN